jgi:membrane protease YdiL (CAAX protease family)
MDQQDKNQYDNHQERNPINNQNANQNTEQGINQNYQNVNYPVNSAGMPDPRYYQPYGSNYGPVITQQERILNVYPPDYGNEDNVSDGEPQAPTARVLSKVAFFLFMMGVAVLLSQQIISFVVDSFWPEIAKTNWYLWAVTAFSMIGIGLPVFYLLTRSIPEPKKGEVVKLKPLQFISIFLISTAVMYITNFFSVFLTFIIAMLKGGDYLDLNPLMDMMIDSNLILRVLYASFAAPIVEELIFRKLLLNKLRRYGDIPAILISSIAFGLFHMNVAQMFYATALGIIFAYVAIRTNSIRYNILLHILINSMGVIIAPLAMKQSMIFNFVIVGWVFTCITLGILLFTLNVKKIRLYRIQKPMEKKSGYLLNLGTILYTILCMIMIIAQVVAS